MACEGVSPPLRRSRPGYIKPKAALRAAMKVSMDSQTPWLPKGAKDSHRVSR